MKKLITVFLALAMIFAMSIPAFAADATVTIGTDANHSYKGYQLMTLTTSLKCDANHEHGKDCYNYAYSVNDAYLATLITAINVAEVDTAEEVIAYIDTLADDSAAMNTLAKAIYDNIADKNSGTTITGNNATELAQGYWLFADVTNLGADANDAISFIMVKTQGQDNLVINPKVGLPEVTKEVNDVNDSTGANAWGESADADIGDYVDFKLTATLGDYFDSYETYKLIFHDDLGTGFALDDTAKASIVVKVYADDTKAQELTLENDAYDINYTTADEGCDFEVIFDDITTIENITKNAVFEVTYKAKLTDTAVVGGTGNPNTVTLEYSNNPYDENSTGETSDNVVVYTYKLIIDKKALAEDGAALPGAGFTLYKMIGGAKTEIAKIDAANDRTQFVWTGLDDGNYILEESTVPAGYNKMTDLEFTITANHTITGITGLAADGMDIEEDDITTGTIKDVVVNNTGTVLPETGGMGTMWLIFGGAMLVILAGVVMITRKKMSVYAD